MSCASLFKGRAVWTVLLVATFVCCSLIMYNLLLHYKTRCTSQESCSNSYQTESAKLGTENCRTDCNTKECIEIANLILNKMNHSADPCKDFSTFACGNYRDRFDSNSYHSIMNDLEEDIELMIKDIIETSNETQIAGSAAQKLKIVYDSCMNSKSSDMSAIRSMLEFLDQMGIPNWPHLDSNFSFINPTFEESLGKLMTYQEDLFLKFVKRDPRIDFPLDQAFFNITVESHYDNSKVDGGLKKIVMGILKYTDMDNNDINRTLEEFMDVENRLRILYKENEANVYCEEEEPTKDIYVDCSRKNSSESMLCRIWDSVIRNGGISTYVSKDLVKINCEHTHYIENLPSVLSSYNHRTLAHYIALKVFINNLKYMSFSMRKNVRYITNHYDYIRQDKIFQLDHWKFCVSWIAENMKLPLGIMYGNQLWRKDKTEQLDDLVNEYKQAFIQFSEEQDWIDEVAEQIIVKKVEEIENLIYKIIGWFRNATKINNDYRQFHPTPNDFFRNVMNHKKLQFSAKFWMFWEEIFIQDLPWYDVQPSAEYNSIFLSFGVLQPPHFKYGYPKLFNNAGIGQSVGHELVHMYMDIFMIRWRELDNTTRQHIKEKQGCLIDQYSGFQSKRIKKNVDGGSTMYENFCDNLSLRVTEKVAEQVIRTMEADNFTLPGLPYSPKELFYIFNAQRWCEVRSMEWEYKMFYAAGHSPSEYRIIGPLQNSKKFAEVFHCPSTSYMNPEKKCIVFD